MDTPVTLRPVTAADFHDVIRLKVKEEQETFVASNVYSIAQARFYESWQPTAIYADGQVIGFVMWGIDDDQPVEEWWIIRLMIDARYQGQGYGRAATLAVIEQLQQQGIPRVFLSFEPENTGAQALYRSVGFVDTGRVEYGEIVYSLDLT